jgi:hypothetical protein
MLFAAASRREKGNDLRDKIQSRRRALSRAARAGLGRPSGPMIEAMEGRVLLTDFSGNITGNVVWDVAHSPYNLVGSVNVQSGATLTVNSGVTVNGPSSYANLYVQNGGRLAANGATFNTPIAFDASATATLSGNTFNRTMPVECPPGLVPALAGNTYAPATQIEVRGSLATNAIWPLITNVAYYMDGSTSVQSGATLTVNSGVTVNGPSSYANLYVQNGGRLAANGATFNTPIDFEPSTSGNLQYCKINSRIDIDSGSTASVHYNDFSSGMVATTGNSASTVDVTNNWWGTTDASVIAAVHITDHQDQSWLPTAVYQPFLSSPPVGAPEVSVSANGQNIADGDSTPSTIDGTDFGTSASPVDRTFTVTNAGSATLTLSGLTVPSSFSIVNGLSSSLAPGASDTFTVRFLATGNASGQVNFGNNDSNENPFNFSIVGTLATAPEVVVSGNGQNIVDGDSTPSTIDGTDFGTSASPVDRTFTVTNAGSATLTLSGLTVPSSFSIVNGLSSSLAPGASDTFTVRFLATGNASGQVSFANNDSNENPFNFSVVGTRLPGSNLPLAPRNLTATPFSTTRVDLSWTDRSSNEDGFWVDVRDDTAGGGWQRYKNCAQNTSSCAVRTLYDNSLYSFRVCSYTAGGASAWAQVLSVKTPDNGSLATAGDRGNAPVRPHVKDIEDRIGPADPRDYFKYRMVYAGKLKVVLDELTAGEGVNVKLMRLNANGTTTQVGFASTATRDNPTIQTGWIAAGNYCVRVQQNSASDATDYRLMVLADYAGESMTRAHPIIVPPGGARDGWIGDGDGQDWYRFNLGSAGKVRINLSGLSDDLDVKLLDTAGNQISRSELGGSSTEEIEKSLGAGRYYIVVYAPSGESSGYRLGVGLG